MALSNTFSITIQAPTGGGGDVPTWFAAMPDKTWAAVASAGTLDAVKPSGASGHQHIVATGSGGAVDTDRKSLLVCGGGESNYSGNEVYELVLTENTPAWVRLTDPSDPAGGTLIPGTYADGQPKSSRNWDMLVYGAGNLWLAGMANMYPTGYHGNGIWRFNRAVSPPVWVQDWTAPGPTGGNGLSEEWSQGTASYDATSGVVFATGSGATSYYYFNGSSSGSVASQVGSGLYSTSAISPSLRAWAHLSPPTTGYGQFRVVNLTDGTVTSPAISGSLPSSLTGPGFVWHAASNAFLIWQGGATLYKLTPGANPFTGTYTVTEVANNSGGVTPTAKASYGTYGRFGLVPNLGGAGIDALVVVNGTTQATYVYKIPVGGV